MAARATKDAAGPSGDGATAQPAAPVPSAAQPAAPAPSAAPPAAPAPSPVRPRRQGKRTQEEGPPRPNAAAAEKRQEKRMQPMQQFMARVPLTELPNGAVGGAQAKAGKAGKGKGKEGQGGRKAAGSGKRLRDERDERDALMALAEVAAKVVECGGMATRRNRTRTYGVV